MANLISTVDADDRPLNTKSAADFLGVSTRSMERWRAQRTGPEYFKLSARAVRYSLAALRRWRDATAVVCGEFDEK
jgi:predicted DNA-binding transcriptional regulator AlpA